MTTINVRSTAILVRDALQMYADAQANRLPGSNSTLAQELAARITGELLPTLRQTYLDMAATEVEWQEKTFQAALANAAETGALLAGFDAATWQRWGVLMLALQTFLDTPIAQLDGETPKDALLQRYIASADTAAP